MVESKLQNSPWSQLDGSKSKSNRRCAGLGSQGPKGLSPWQCALLYSLKVILGLLSLSNFFVRKTLSNHWGKSLHSLPVVDPLVSSVLLELLLALPAEVVESCITAPQVLTRLSLSSNVELLLS